MYLPEYKRYVDRNYSNDNFKAIKSVTDTLDIEFVDIGKEIFEKAEDFRILFPFGESGHYNEEGYSRIAKKLNKLIEN